MRPFVVALALWTSPAQADREAEAAAIRELSFTTNSGNPFGQPENEQFMDVEGCRVAVRQFALDGGDRVPLIEGVFDLTRTALEDPAEGRTETIGVGRIGPVAYAETGGFLLLKFNAPYRPIFLTRTDRSAPLVETAYPVFPYLMTPLDDPGRIRRLSAALWRYQAQYCRLTGALSLTSVSVGT